ncbi:MAG: fibronectin type III domain-containing protein [Ruminococcaceae bacterium]|nr:fibronectin type III domain-containing protein [Oscillospiraceae bacterium]
MKKALTKVMLTAITLVILAAIVPLSASASTSNNKSEIFKQLTTELDLNPAAACGIMANMEHESKFDPTLVITDTNGLLSGGLCQWNGGRFSNLQYFCSQNGYNYLSIEGQIAYLRHELSSRSYSYIYDYLKDVSNDAEGAYDAAWYWCYYFEVPANRSYKADSRGYSAETKYWPEFGQVDVKAPSLSLKNKKDPYDIDNSISFKWSDGGDDVTEYYLYVAEKNKKGKYDWSKATVTKLDSSANAKTIKKKTLDKGSYAAYVKAYDSKTGAEEKSNTTKFTVKCLTHSYKSEVTKKATFLKKGTKLLTCKQCGAQKTKDIPKLTISDFKKAKVQNVRVKSYADTKIKLAWEPIEGADGYQIYRKVEGKWKRIATVKDGKASEYLVSKLEPGTKYKLNVRAFMYDSKGKTIVSDQKYPVTASTRPGATKFVSLRQGRKNCKLTWEPEKGVDGYAIYVAKGRNSTDFEHVATVEGSKNVSYTVNNLRSGQVTYFKIKTFNKTTDGYAMSKASDAEYIIAI